MKQVKNNSILDSLLEESIPVKGRTVSKDMVKRDERGRIMKGNTGNPYGRPPKRTIKEQIVWELEHNPALFKKLVTYYIESEKHRPLLWQMLEGSPRQQVDMSGVPTVPIVFNVIKGDTQTMANLPAPQEKTSP